MVAGLLQINLHGLLLFLLYRLKAYLELVKFRTAELLDSSKLRLGHSRVLVDVAAK